MADLMAVFELGRKRGSKGKDEKIVEKEATPSFEDRRRQNLQAFKPKPRTILDTGEAAPEGDNLLG